MIDIEALKSSFDGFPCIVAAIDKMFADDPEAARHRLRMVTINRERKIIIISAERSQAYTFAQIERVCRWLARSRSRAEKGESAST